MIEEGLKDDLNIIANINGDTTGATPDKAVIYYISCRNEKVKRAVEAARRARE
jgi:hypothetical protein